MLGFERLELRAAASRGCCGPWVLRLCLLLLHSQPLEGSFLGLPLAKNCCSRPCFCSSPYQTLGCLQGMANYGKTWANYWGADMLGFSGTNSNPHKLRWSWGPSCATTGVQLWDPASLNVTGGGFGDWVSLLVPAVPSPPACPWVCAQRCHCWVKPSCV